MLLFLRQDHALWFRLDLNSRQSLCLGLLNAGIAGMCHLAQLCPNILTPVRMLQRRKCGYSHGNRMCNMLIFKFSCVSRKELWVKSKTYMVT